MHDETNTTLTTSARTGPLPEGAYVLVETSAGREMMRVGSSAGDGQFFTAQATPVPMSRRDWAWFRFRSWRHRRAQAAWFPVQEWWYSRCERRGCWRRDDGHGDYCSRHMHEAGRA